MANLRLDGVMDRAVVRKGSSGSAQPLQSRGLQVEEVNLMMSLGDDLLFCANKDSFDEIGSYKNEHVYC